MLILNAEVHIHIFKGQYNPNEMKKKKRTPEQIKQRMEEIDQESNSERKIKFSKIQLQSQRQLPPPPYPLLRRFHFI